METILENT